MKMTALNIASDSPSNSGGLRMQDNNPYFLEGGRNLERAKGGFLSFARLVPFGYVLFNQIQGGRNGVLNVIVVVFGFLPIVILTNLESDKMAML